MNDNKMFVTIWALIVVGITLCVAMICLTYAYDTTEYVNHNYQLSGVVMPPKS